MNSTLVVFYSLTGNSRRLAQLLAAQNGWPVGEVVEVRPRIASGWGFVRCALDSLFHRRPVIVYEGLDPAAFASVVLVTPIWMGELAGPMRSFVAIYKERMRRFAVLTTMGGRGSSNAFAEIARIAKRDPVIGETVTAREVEDGSCAQAVEAFAKAVELSPPGRPLRPAVLSPAA
jgi:flavodoxin